MDLTRMDRQELGRLQKDLQTLATAADALAGGGLEPEICLTAEETILRAPPILSQAREPGPVMVEPIEIDIEPVPAEPAPRSTAPIEPAAPASPPPGDAAAPAGGTCPVRPAGRQKAAGDRVTGPLSETERAEIVRRHADGAIAADIARALNRKPQVVALFLLGQERKAETQSRHVPRMNQKAGQPAPDLAPVAAGQDEDGRSPATAEGKAEPAVPGAGGAAGFDTGVPGGERGGLQQHGPAEKAPVQIAVAGGRKLGPATAVEAPDDLHGLSRLIWQHLVEIGPARGWDLETDLEICETFGQGRKADVLALDLGLDPKQVIDRYRQMTAVIRDDRGHMTIDGLERFIRVLRRRVGEIAERRKSA